MKKIIFLLLSACFSLSILAADPEYLYWHDKDFNVYKKDGTFVGKVNKKIIFGHSEIFDPGAKKSLEKADKFYIKPDGSTFFMHDGKEMLLTKIKISFYI